MMMVGRVSEVYDNDDDDNDNNQGPIARCMVTADH